MQSALTTRAQSPPSRPEMANAVLAGSATFWFVMALLGQWAFFAYIAAFYGPTTLTGHFEGWTRNKMLITGYQAGDSVGNLAFGLHGLAAGIIAFGGALQLVPQVRARFPTFHRWNGRLFLATVTGLSLSGFYLVWVRHTTTGLLGAVAITLNGLTILTCAALTLRTAMARRFEAHRRWAMRIYLVSNAQWFFRVGVFGWFVAHKLVGAHTSFASPFVGFWGFGCYLVPLGMLELYLRARDGGGPVGRYAVAGALVVLTLAMSLGAFAFSMLSLQIVTGSPK